MKSLRPFEPTAERPWDRRLAGHLLERAGFGGTVADVDELVELGFDGAVSRLVDYPIPRQQPAPEFLTVTARDPRELRGLDEQARRLAFQELQRQQRLGVAALKAWWIERMVTGEHPLEEKLTLFWHGHFATEAQKVKNGAALFAHYETLRHHARGKFGRFLLAVSTDPAMLIYLDNQLNQKGRPNENYARELFELFSLGIGHYTEDDVRESARAFTGWGVAGTRQQFGQTPSFQFNPRQHDDGEKTVLGETGNLDGGDVIDQILEQPSCATFICRKLYRYFVTDTPDADDEAVIADLAALWRAEEYHLAPLYEALFRSEAFYDESQFGAVIKSPVQLVVGTLRRVGARLPEQAMRGLIFQLAGMGQNPFDPPNVAGWAGGEEWINTSTLLQRYNLAGALLGAGRRAVPLDWGKLGVAFAGDGPALAAALAEQFLAVPLEAEQVAELGDYLTAQIAAGGLETARRTGVHLICSTPHYQVC